MIYNYLKGELFYDAWIRYMIEGNFIMVHSCLFILYISGSFNDLMSTLNTVSRIVIFTIFFIWPFFVAAFLYMNRHKLSNKDF